jgi:small subunit ribosomal protein S2
MGGFKEMTTLPSALFIVDSIKESIAIKEAKRMGIPVMAIVDTNCNPDEIDYPIPANDDAIRAIRLMCSKIADAVLEGKNSFMVASEEETADDGMVEAGISETSETLIFTPEEE